MAQSFVPVNTYLLIYLFAVLAAPQQGHQQT
jgi:hypothetical protein